MTSRHRWTPLLLLLLALGLSACEALLTRPLVYGTLRVEAKSRRGAPLPGIRAMLYVGPRIVAYAETDDAGRATFARVPRGNYGVLMELPPQYGLLSEINAGAPGNIIDGIDVGPGTDTTITFTFLRRGAGSIEAEVVDQRELPVPGLTVVAYRSSVIVDSARTDDFGVARIPVQIGGGYGVFVSPPDSLGVPGAAWVFRDGLSVDAEMPTRLRLVVQRCLGLIHARVLDQFDALVPGIPVTLYTGAGLRETRSTDSTGRALFVSVPCNEYGTWVSAAPGFSVTFERGIGYVDGLRVTNGATLEPTLRVTRQ